MDRSREVEASLPQPGLGKRLEDLARGLLAAGPWLRPVLRWSRLALSAVLRRTRLQWLTVDRRTEPYLEIGCENLRHEGFVQIDYVWFPHVAVVCDAKNGLPFFRSQRFSGAFCEHMLEHLPFAEGVRFLREVRRVLKPGATFRLIVPDAGLYLDAYARSRRGEPASFPNERWVPSAYGLDRLTPLMHVNGIYYESRNSPTGHCFMYDFETARYALELAGFSDVRRCAFQEGREPALMIDKPERRIESLYVEASA